jgi:DNA-binding CsgD family transcriptional regulator
MSSASRIAVAPAYVEPESTPPPHAFPWLAALDTPESRNPGALAQAWEDLVRGRLRPLRDNIGEDSVCFVAQVIGRPTGLTLEDASLVADVLCGRPRKAVAADAGMALSTATGRFLRALSKIELADRNVPLPVVLAAQCRSGVAPIRSVRSALFDYDGCRCLAISVPRPATGHLTSLTRGEQEIAQWVIEGLTRHEIAERRETSVHTVAGQCHAVFAALRVTGRYELIRRAVELCCFHELGIADST